MFWKVNWEIALDVDCGLELADALKVAIGFSSMTSSMSCDNALINLDGFFDEVCI